MRKIVIFGSTGSIGTSLIKILKKNIKEFKIELLTAHTNYKKLLKQAELLNVKNIIITDNKSFLIVKKILKKQNKHINIYNDFNSFKKIFKDEKIDYTMSSISGFEGLKPTLEIIKFTKTIAIANKESIICGWSLIKKKLNKHNTKFIPINSSRIGRVPMWNKIVIVEQHSIKRSYCRDQFLTSLCFGNILLFS